MLGAGQASRCTCIQWDGELGVGVLMLAQQLVTAWGSQWEQLEGLQG